MVKIELVSYYLHVWDNEWHFDIFYVENDFASGNGRSLFGIGKKGDLFFLDLFWIRLLPILD